MAEPAKGISPEDAVEQVRKELAALPEGRTLSWDEAMSYVRRLPRNLAPGETSADIIRELRGPLPEDDPDFVNVRRG
jgi:hypothetical protein